MLSSALRTFNLGGVHPASSKDRSAGLAIQPMPLPAVLRVSMSQHLGAPATPLVKARQEVVEGELIASVEKGLGANIHCPATGVVKKIVEIPHPSLGRVQAVEIQPDPEAARVEYTLTDWRALTTEEMLARIREAGVVGMGGAGFPTYIKLAPPPGTDVDVLLLNGVECESYVTADHRLMLERTTEIVEGARILLTVLGIKKAVVGIEVNKPDAIAAFEKVLSCTADTENEFDISVCHLAVKYPQGSEKQLIQAATGRRVPSGSLPAHAGVLVQNVGTTFATYEAVALNKNCYERVLTVTGGGAFHPANLLCRVGTLISDIVEHLGGLSDRTVKCILGGPMMGYALADLNYPVCKNNTGLLFLTEEETDLSGYGACIRCGRCLDACPMGLMPNEMSVWAERERFSGIEKFGLWDCFECGSCAYVCPAKRPLVQFIRTAKTKAKRS